MEPQTLSQGFAELIANYPPGHHLHEIATQVAKAQRRCHLRRTAVLMHQDLAERLTKAPLYYHRASQWNGWIPPAEIASGGDEELCRSADGRLNQRGKYAASGMSPNDSEQRAALIAISREAWDRQQEDA